MSAQKNSRQPSGLYSAVDSTATAFPPTYAPRPATFSERHQEPGHRHRDLEAAINRYSEELAKQRRALEKLTQKMEEDKERQRAADRDRDSMIGALEHLIKSVFTGDWDEYLKGWGIFDKK